MTVTTLIEMAIEKALEKSNEEIKGKQKKGKEVEEGKSSISIF